MIAQAAAPAMLAAAPAILPILRLFDGYQYFIPGFKDLIQILIVAAGFYFVLLVLVRTRALQILFGFLFIVGLYFVARLLDLGLVRYLLEKLLQYGAFAALIVFQPELRSALARLGQSRMRRFFATRLGETEVVEEIVEAIERLSRAKIGAIIAVQREIGLAEYVESGTVVQARVSQELLTSIFSPYGPLHDGAVLIEGDTIIAASVILPLTQFPVADRSLGTRHRAALGLSEETDALVIVVSEETAQISVAQRGRLERDIDLEQVRDLLSGEATVVAGAVSKS